MADGDCKFEHHYILRVDGDSILDDRFDGLSVEIVSLGSKSVGATIIRKPAPI